MDLNKAINTFFDTWKSVLLQPEQFFTNWDQNEGWENVIVFNVICGLISGVLSTILTLGGMFFNIILNPIFTVIGTFIGGIILYLCFMIFGGKGGAEPTIKMVGYSQAISVITAGIPFIGLLAVIWQIWILIVGGKIVHQLDTGKSAFAVLIPFIVCFGLVLVGAVIFGAGIFALIMGSQQ